MIFIEVLVTFNFFHFYQPKKTQSMKRLLTLFICLGISMSTFAQYASASYIVLHEGMENDYLQLESVWQAYHKESIAMGRKTGWSIWKIAKNGDDSYEAGTYPDYLIMEQYSSKKQMDEEFNRYAEGYESMKTIMKKNLKGKYSNKQIEKILAKAPKKEIRNYIHKRIAATPMIGGDIKVGDVMMVATMEQLRDDYEEFETEFWQNIFANNVMKGNHRFWGFSRIIDRNEAAYAAPTHNSWNMFIDGKELARPDDFVSRKIFELTSEVRKMYTPQELTLVYNAQ